MLKNILFQFTDLYNMTWVHCRVEDKLSVCIKTTASCIQKTKLKNFALAFEHIWLDLEFLNLIFPLNYHPTTLKKQLNYLKWFATMSLWQSNDLSTMLCHQSFLVSVFSQSIGSSFPYKTLFDFFPWFLNYRIFDKFTQFKGCVLSAFYHFYCLNDFIYS